MADLQFPQTFSTDNAGYLLNALICGNYQFQHKETNDFVPISSLHIVSKNIDISQAYFNFKIMQAHHQNYARQLGSTRQNVATPEYIAQICKKFSLENSLKYVEISGEELLDEKLELIYNVGKGSVNKPKLISMEYNGNPEQPAKKVAFIGKGIVFDTGGYNLKPTGSIESMFLDKCGACTVVSAFMAIVQFKMKINIVCSIGLADNAVDGNAYKPFDIITSFKGLKVEIGNTDAEGRLVLADVMSWTQKHASPSCMVELSTLTGACMTALGLDIAGVFTNNKDFANEILQVGQLNNEQFWVLPLTDTHRNEIKSQFADISNKGKTAFAGASQAAAFLECFVEKNVDWAHIDIAGPSGVNQKCASGFGTQTLIEFALRYQQHKI